ncbi:MAG: LytTR family DNA-binding domain-containing protein [Bacteroidota bacterium]
MKINCIIVDDEALARKGIEKYVRQIDFLELKAVCKNAMQANIVLNEDKIDLLFLDIEMPMISGLQLLRSLVNAPKVIFTTAYSEYALDSFEYDVVDYLVKPISFERFLQAANKAHRLFSDLGPSVKNETSKKEDDFIFIKTDKQLVKITFKDILFVESMQNYIRIFMDKESHLTLVPLKKIIAMLPPDEFMHVHKSFLVAKNKVEAIVGNQLIIGEHKIPIGRSVREEVLSSLVKDKILKK